MPRRIIVRIKRNRRKQLANLVEQLERDSRQQARVSTVVEDTIRKQQLAGDSLLRQGTIRQGR